MQDIVEIKTADASTAITHVNSVHLDDPGLRNNREIPSLPGLGLVVAVAGRTGRAGAASLAQQVLPGCTWWDWLARAVLGVPSLTSCSTLAPIQLCPCEEKVSEVCLLLFRKAYEPFPGRLPLPCDPPLPVSHVQTAVG